MPADLLERLWTELVNVDPAGKWIDASAPENLESPVATAYSEAIKRVRKSVSLEDLGRFVRFARYEACFGCLYAFEDPGLPKMPIGELVRLIPSVLAGGKAPNSVAKYFEALDLTNNEESDGEWIADLAASRGDNGPFGDTAPAVKRALKAGATALELDLIANWQGRWATLKTHEFLKESGHDFLEGFHEVFLGCDPSGMEGRPGSWPLGANIQAPEKIAPLWKVRSGQAVAFAPDSKRVAIAGASGPARIFDVRNGKELVVCEGLKAHISKLAFSPDAKRLAIAQIQDRCDVCDANTGKLIKKRVFPKWRGDWDYVSGLAFGPNQELLRAAWVKTIGVAEADTWRVLEPIHLASGARSVHGIAFSEDRRRLAVVWQSRNQKTHQATLFSWPERETLLRFTYDSDHLCGISLSSDARLIAVTYDQFAEPKSNRGIHLYDATSGQCLHTWPGPKGRNPHFVGSDYLFCDDDDHLWAADLKSPEKTGRIRMTSENSSLYEIAISPSGKYLATAGSSGAAVWEIPTLLATSGL